ncbi:MAG: AMP-binding protein [Verrucomicrobiota bacterium]
MEPAVETFRKRLQLPWLVEGQEAFLTQFEEALKRIQNMDTPIIIEDDDQVTCLARAFAALATGCPAFLANSQWQASELAQLNALDLSQAELGHLMIPTGGTGGRIKFAMHTWESLCAAVEGYAAFYQASPVNCWCTLPLYHVSGLMQALRSFTTDGQLVLTDYRKLEAHPQLDRSTFHLSLVPTQLKRILESEGGADWLRGFGLILIGGAGLSQELAAKASDQQLPLSTSYGMTETAAVIAAQKPADFLAGYAPAGQLLPHASAAIFDGEVILRGRSLFRGYFPAAPHACSSLATGDEGELDADGRLLIHGRLDRFINTGGEKVDPRIVEAAIRQRQPEVGVLVVGQPDADWGERVTAIVSGLSPDQLPKLRQGLRAALQPHMLPRSWHLTDQLPLRPNGKIDPVALARCLESN